MRRRFVEVCKRRDLKINIDKSKVMVLRVEERSVCGVILDGRQLEHISEFMFLVSALDESNGMLMETGKWEESCRCDLVNASSL